MKEIRNLLTLTRWNKNTNIIWTILQVCLHKSETVADSLIENLSFRVLFCHHLQTQPVLP